MFLYLKKKKCLNNLCGSSLFQYTHLKKKKIFRKAKLSPPNTNAQKQDTGTFFFAPLRGTLTVEAAIVLPLFLMVMVAVLQYGSVMGTAARFGASMTETGKQMAIAAYLTKYGGNADQAPGIAGVALSEVYAQSKIMSQVGDTSNVKNANMLLSSFLKKDETIDLVLTYQIRSPFGIVQLPGNMFLQRARVRAWTGRVPPDSNSSDNNDAQDTYVYVTTTGSVYHDDPDCTHLRLSIREVDAASLTTLRNSSGGKYHACEKCGEASPGGTVYITNEGDRYHSSVNCSGLKRTVRQITKEEAGSLQACSRCGK
jgi:hypothetical protein